MSEIRIEHELNRTLLILSGQEYSVEEDYRHRMLSENDIKGLIPLNFQSINGNREARFDITHLVSLSEYFSTSDASRDDVKGLFEAILRTTESASEFFLEEGNILLGPDVIFYDPNKQAYEFICAPVSEPLEKQKSSIKDLLKFLMVKVDTNDEKLVEAIFEADEKTETERIGFTDLYENLIETLKRTDSDEVEEESEADSIDIQKEEDDKLHGLYIPSFKELIAALMILSGTIMIAYNVYLKMLESL